MSSPDDSERSDDSPNSDYAPKWARDIYRQGSPDTAKGGPPPSQRDLTFLRRSLDPETVDVPQPTPRRLGWFATGGGLIIAAALGAVIGLLATGELRSIFGNAPSSTTKTIELTSRSDNSRRLAVSRRGPSPHFRCPRGSSSPRPARGRSPASGLLSPESSCYDFDKRG